MFNEELAYYVTKQYGRKAAIIYCNIESYKFKKQAEEFEKTKKPEEPNEFEYEAEWWRNKANELWNY